jgi:hypothetical protein
MQVIGEGEGHHHDLLQAWVARFERLGVGEWVGLAVEILRPFSFVGAQMIHFFSPVLTAFSSSTQIEQLAELLESPEALDQLSEVFSSPAHSERHQP